MSDTFKKLISQVKEKYSSKILSLVLFGSGKGVANHQISDVDLFLIVKDKKDIPEILDYIRSLEVSLLHIHHKKTSEYLEQSTFGSDDFTGLHLIALSKDELARNYQPKSWRLKLLTAILVDPLLLFYNLKHDSKVLFGEDIIHKLKLPKPSFNNRLKAFSTLFLLLIMIPFMGFKKDQFKVWCFKIIKYHQGLIETYAKVKFQDDNLSYKDLAMDTSMFSLAEEFRYKVDSYHQSLIMLYISVWLFILKHWQYLLFGPKLKK